MSQKRLAVLLGLGEWSSPLEIGILGLVEQRLVSDSCAGKTINAARFHAGQGAFGIGEKHDLAIDDAVGFHVVDVAGPTCQDPEFDFGIRRGVLVAVDLLRIAALDDDCIANRPDRIGEIDLLTAAGSDVHRTVEIEAFGEDTRNQRLKLRQDTDDLGYSHLLENNPSDLGIGTGELALFRVAVGNFVREPHGHIALPT
jgi:hypothetical protein